ncbi:MAG: VWA domain-containing protein [Alteromonadaceae bacterium]|nr:VWA domain-containing protein [Alteromonadaceae bacterium]
MKFRRRAESENNTALLDIMACGLGAVLLILILIKFKAFTADPSEETKKLEAELAAAADLQTQLRKSIDEINDLIALESSKQSQDQAAQADTQSQQDKLMQDISTEIAIVADLENQLAAMAKLPTPDANIALSGSGEQNYITGLIVKGAQIGILIDKSASMMGDDLVQVLGNLSLSDGQKVSTPKWRRTLRTAKWLLARVPENSRVSMVAFSEDAVNLGSRNASSPKVSASMDAIVKDLGSVVPNGGTNLQVGIKTLFETNSSITDVYLVTDGLPTLGDGQSISCKNFFKSSKSISSECRQQLLVETAKRFPRNVILNVVLLPIEGDPFAPAMYWEWANVTRGTFLAPAPEWP